MTNVRRETRCHICGADITDPVNDWQLRLVRTEPRTVEFGDLTCMETGHYGYGSWHLCERCSEAGIEIVRRAMEKEAR